MATGTIMSGNWKLLWENANPTNSFSPQQISIAGTKYAFFLVSYKAATAANARSICSIHAKNELGVVFGLYANKLTERFVNTITDTYIEFGNGARVDPYGSYVEDQTVLIPYQVWGVS